MTVSEARRLAATILDRSPILDRDDYSSARDTLVLLAYFCGHNSAWLLAHSETDLDEGPASAFLKAVERRATGIPVAYITGIKEFWGLPFTVTPAVLIPKPDTEILVERAVEVIKMLTANTSTKAGTVSADNAVPAADHVRPESNPLRVLDVCTGSGCIAVSLLHDCPYLSMTALDISGEALSVAERNAQLVTRPIRFIRADLRDGLPPPENVHHRGYHLIVSNPPYVPTDIAQGLLADGRGEPMLALDGGDDGLCLVRPLIDKALAVLVSGGYLLIETGEYNAKSAAKYLKASGFIDIVIHRDLEGQERVLEGRLP